MYLLQFVLLTSNFYMVGLKQFWCVSAFSTAEEFHLEELLVALSKTKLYEPTCLYNGSDDCIGK